MALGDSRPPGIQKSGVADLTLSAGALEEGGAGQMYLGDDTDNSAVRPYPPGDLAIWIFVLAELLVFGIFCSAYAFALMNSV